jgi:hypothetical protein
MPNFTDSEVNSYVEELNLYALQSLIDDLLDDFDNAISSRFTVSSSQASTLSNTPVFFKSVITSAFKNLYVIQSSSASATFEISGLDMNGSGYGLTADGIIIEIGHRPDCTWYIKVSINKS